MTRWPNTCFVQQDGALSGTFHMVQLRNWGTLLVAQLVEALCYKPEGCGFDYRWCHWNFSLT
jgi:hypothetical protein